MSGNSERASCPADGKGGKTVRGIAKFEAVSGARMRDFTTIGIGGSADRMVFPRTVRDVQEILTLERDAGREVLALGAGSNLLVSDAGVRATVLCLKKNLVRIVFAERESIVAEGGAMLPRFAVLCALSGLSGAEELAGIPGTVGGALTMNAGAYGRSIGELVEWIEIVDPEGRLHRVTAREIGFGYRRTSLPVGGIVARAALRLAPGHVDAAFERMRQFNERRRAKQPWGERTFGSTFANPPGGGKAGDLLENAGMKGVSQGDASYSEKHANFIVNRGRAAASDVLALIARGRKEVLRRSGITLALEVRLWGIEHA